MFSKSKETEVSTPAPQPAPKRAQRPTNVPSIISGDLTVTGTLVSAGDVQVDGRVEGDIRASALVIGEKAVIQGDVYADDAVVRGRVEGSIRAHKVQLCATSHVEGNILHQALSVEAGAFFEGNCRHSDNPLGDSMAPSRRPAVQPAAPAPQPAQQPARPAPNVATSAPIVSSTPIKSDSGTAPQRPAASFTALKG